MRLLSPEIFFLTKHFFPLNKFEFHFFLTTRTKNTRNTTYLRTHLPAGGNNLLVTLRKKVVYCVERDALHSAGVRHTAAVDTGTRGRSRHS